MMFATPAPYLEAEYAFRREQIAADFRGTAYRRQVRARRRARKLAAAHRLAVARVSADVR
jgi:hypothetical protein